MGIMGYSSSGGHIYNQVSSTNGTMAYFYEGSSLDSCGGHSDPTGTYHYHKVHFPLQ
jgi:hypothetical protein